MMWKTFLPYMQVSMNCKKSSQKLLFKQNDFIMEAINLSIQTPLVGTSVRWENPSLTVKILLIVSLFIILWMIYR